MKKKNILTTIFGVLAAIPAIAHTVGVTNIGHIGSGDVLTLLQGLGVLGLGYFAKDKTNTDGE